MSGSSGQRASTWHSSGGCGRSNCASGLWRGTATVRLSPRGLERLPLLLGAVESRAARDTVGEPDSEGWARVVLPIESLPHAEANMLRLGAEAEVIEPVELRDRIAQTVREMTARYTRAR